MKNLRSEAAILTGLFLLALIVRLATAAALGVSQAPESDEIEYFQPAESFSRGEGLRKVPQQSPDNVAHPSAFRMPLPSILMGVGFLLFGHHHAVARYVSIVFGSLAVPLMYRFAGRIAPRPAALLASVGVALHPVLIFNTVLMVSEPYLITTLLLALDLSAAAAGSRSARSGLLAGLAWGLAILVKPHAAPMAFLVMLYLFAHSSWRAGIWLAVGVVALMAPWVVRNRVAVGRPVLLATEGGETFLGSNNPYVLDDPKLSGMWLAPMGVEEYRTRLGPIRDELRRNEEQYAIASAFLGENPRVIPTLVYRKLVRWLTPITESRGAIRLAILGTYGLLLLLLAVGAFRGAFRASVPLHLCLICSAVLTLITAVYWGALTRGRMPLEILWIPWGAWTAWDLSRALLGARLGPPIAEVGGLDQAA